MITLLGSLASACGGATAARDTNEASSVTHQTSDPHASSSPWSGCSVRAMEGTVSEISCAEGRIRVMRVNVFQGRSGLEAMLRARGVEPTSATFSEREVGGQRYPVAHAEQFEGWPWLANPAPQTAGVCAATQAACMELFDRIARVGLPTDAAFPPSDMNVAGLALTVPQGCELQGAERIRCAGGALDWRNGTRGGIETYPRALAAAGFTLTRQLPATCRLGDMSGRALVVVATHASGPAVLTLCEVEGPSGMSVAMCLGYDPRTMPAAPEPCDQIFGSVTLAP